MTNNFINNNLTAGPNFPTNIYVGSNKAQYNAYTTFTPDSERIKTKAEHKMIKQ